MNVRRTLVPSLFLALAFFLGAGEASVQYRGTRTYVWRNGDGQTRSSSLSQYNPNHFLPTWNPTPNQVFRLQRR
jgi:hypothetical protein